MKITSILTFVFSHFFFSTLFGQSAHFVNSGKIEFLKTANMYAIIQKDIDNENESFWQQAFDQYKKNQPQFKKLKSTLTFSDNKTLFSPEVVETAQGGFFDNIPLVNQNNIIFTDFNKSKSIVQKNVFEEVFLISDSIRKIRWKITDEKRDILGYSCRRANAIVMDSIYVVAFYTDQIPISGGPESFSGLPGMILGLALPHENINWFATKVSDMPVDSRAMLIPKKGKAVNMKELKSTLKDVMKNWGSYARSRLKGFLL